ncbi:MAG: class I SAM-dependent methyltransferase [bacterium]
MNQSLKERAISILRAARLLPAYNHLKYYWVAAAHGPANRAFRAEHPDFPVPPLPLAYDAYGHVGLADYRESGRRHAAFLADLLRRHAPGWNPLRVLEWGCGPARVIRHLPALLPPGSEFLGTDYNPTTIAWCRKAIPNMRFEENKLEPPLPFGPAFFDVVYCLSVFTHLSEEMHYAWRDELLRVLKPGGLLILTAHGDFYRERHLFPHERAGYDAGKLVVRGRVEEGKKWFAAFHSPAFMRERFLKGTEIVEHITRPIHGSIEQDVWVVKKPSGA